MKKVLISLLVVLSATPAHAHIIRTRPHINPHWLETVLVFMVIAGFIYLLCRALFKGPSKK